MTQIPFRCRALTAETAVPPRIGRAFRRAVLLLEVVVALAVLVAAMGLLCAQLAGGLDMTAYAEEQLRASLLADRVVGLVQLDPVMEQLMLESEELEAAFTDESALGYPLADAPGYFWRVTNEPVDRENEDQLRLVTIEVLYQRDEERLDSIDDAEVVRQIALLKAAPATIDLVEDAGLSEELIEQVQQMVPIAGFDPRAVDLHQLVALLDEDTVMQLLPMLMPLLAQLTSGGVPSELSDLAGEFGVGGEVDRDALGGSSAEDLLGVIREAAGDAGRGPGGAGRQPGPGGRSRPGRSPGPPIGGGGGRRGSPPPGSRSGSGVDVGQGSGPNGEYTIEDLMRMRDEFERQQRGGR